MLSSRGHNCFTCPHGQGHSEIEIKCHEDEVSMRTPDSLSLVLKDEDPKPDLIRFNKSNSAVNGVLPEAHNEE